MSCGSQLSTSQKINLLVRIVDRDIIFSVNIQFHKTVGEAVKIIAEEYNESFCNVPQFEKLDPESLFIVDEYGAIYSKRQKIGKIYRADEPIYLKSIGNMNELSFVSTSMNSGIRSRKSDCPLPSKIIPRNNSLSPAVSMDLLSRQMKNVCTSEDERTGENFGKFDKQFAVSAAPSPSSRVAVNEGHDCSLEMNESIGKKGYGKTPDPCGDGTDIFDKQYLEKEKCMVQEVKELVIEDLVQKSVLVSTEKEKKQDDSNYLGPLSVNEAEAQNESKKLDENNKDKVVEDSSYDEEDMDGVEKVKEPPLNVWETDTTEEKTIEKDDNNGNKDIRKNVTKINVRHGSKSALKSTKQNELEQKDEQKVGEKKVKNHEQRIQNVFATEEMSQKCSTNPNGKETLVDRIDINSSESEEENSGSNDKLFEKDKEDEKKQENEEDSTHDIWKKLRESSSAIDAQQKNNGKISPLEKSDGSDDSSSSESRSNESEASSYSSSSSSSSSDSDSSTSSSSSTTTSSYSSKSNSDDLSSEKAPSPIVVEGKVEQKKPDKNESPQKLKDKISENSDNSENMNENDKKSGEDQTESNENSSPSSSKSDSSSSSSSSSSEEEDIEDEVSSNDNDNSKNSSEQKENSNNTKNTQSASKEQADTKKSVVPLKKIEIKTQLQTNDEKIAEKEASKPTKKTTSNTTSTEKNTRGARSTTQSQRSTSVSKAIRGSFGSSVRLRGKERGGFSGMTRISSLPNLSHQVPAHQSQYDVLNILGSATESGKNAAT